MSIIDRLNDSEMYVDAIDDAIAEIKRLRAKNKAKAKQAIELRRALLTLSSAHELELEHIYGEMDSLWNAREVVSKFIREGTQ